LHLYLDQANKLACGGALHGGKRRAPSPAALLSRCYRPVLLETFVELSRFQGTCYRAANWTLLGNTKGRGKLDPDKQALLPKKAIWIYPIANNFRQFLCVD
jgi:hypothetical protein